MSASPAAGGAGRCASRRGRAVRRLVRAAVAAAVFAAVLVAAPQPASAEPVQGYIHTTHASNTFAVWENHRPNMVLCRKSGGTVSSNWHRHTHLGVGAAASNWYWKVSTKPSESTGHQPHANPASDDDFTATSGAKKVSTGVRKSCFTVPIPVADDNIVEPDETYTVLLTKFEHLGHAPDYAVYPLETKVLTIRNQDGVLSVSDETVEEGGDLVFTVSMDDSVVPGGHTVTPTLEYYSAEAADVRVNLQPIRFSGFANETHQITIPTVDDNIVEASDVVRLTVTSSNPNMFTGEATGTGTITDNDSATVTVSDSDCGGGGCEEGYGARYTVSVDNPVEHPFTVTVTPKEDSSATKAAKKFAAGVPFNQGDFLATADTFTFQGRANESHAGSVYIAANVDEDDGQGNERDGETFKLEAAVSGYVGTVSVAAASTATIKNSSVTDIVLTATGEVTSEGSPDSDRYWVVTVAKNHVNWDPANGNITVGLKRTGGTLSSDEYHTEGGKPKFTCWDKYPSRLVDSTFDEALDANVPDSGVDSDGDGTNDPVTAGHQCAIAGGDSFDAVYLKLYAYDDEDREPDETIELELEFSTYHNDSTAPDVRAAEGESTPTLTLSNDDLEQVALEWVNPPLAANQTTPLLAEDGVACTGTGCKAWATGGSAAASLRLRAVMQDDTYDSDCKCYPRTPALANTYVTVEFQETGSANHATLSGSKLFIPKGAKQSTGTITVRAIDNKIANDHKTSTNALSIDVLPWSSAGVKRTGGTAFEIYSDDLVDIVVTATDFDEVSDSFTPGPVYELVDGGDQTLRFDVVLRSQPTANVKLTPSQTASVSADTDFVVKTLNGTGSNATLTFTPQNWNIPREITVAAPDGADADAFDALGHILLSPTTTDASYGVIDASIEVVEVDYDAGVVLTGPSGGWGNVLALDEGASASYQVKLAAEPGDMSISQKPYYDVHLQVSLDGAGAAHGSVTLEDGKCDDSGSNARVVSKVLEFTEDNWSTNQTVGVWACEDDADKTSGVATLTHAVVGKPGAPWLFPNLAYSRVQIPDVTVAVTDDDAPAVQLVLRDGPDSTDSVLTGSAVSENGGVAYVTATLESAATQPVTLTVSDAPGTGADASEYTRSGSTLRIAAGATTSTGEVTITARDDLVDDGDKTVLVSATASSGNTTTGPVPTVLTLTDDDSAAVVVTGKTGLPSIAEGGTASYKVHLASKPGGNVVVTPVIPTSNAGDVTITPAALTFTTSNYTTPQTFTVTSLFDEDTADVAQFTVTHTAASAETQADDGYETLSGASLGPVQVSVDDKSAAVSLSAAALSVEEGGASPFAAYSVVLAAAPTQDVTVTVGWASTPARDTELRFVASGACPSDTGATTKTLTFTASNWFRAQDVAVCAAEDSDEAAGAAVLTHTVTSTDSSYSGLAAGTVRLTEADNDVEALRFALTPNQPSLASHGEIFVVEGTNASNGPSLGVKLSKQPAADVVVNAMLTGDAFSLYDGSSPVASRTLTFTTTTWDTAQTIRLGSPHDADAEVGTGTLSFTAASNGVALPGLARTLELAQVDDDTAGLAASPRSVAVREGGSASYRIRLTSKPSAAVRVYPRLAAHPDDLAADPAAQPDPNLRVNTGVVTFTPSNWDRWRTVWLYAQSDWDSRSGRAVVSHLVASSDDHYHGLPTGNADVAVAEADDDIAQVVVSGSALDVPEGGSAAYALRLSRRPNRSVTVQVRSQTTGDTDLTADTDPDTSGNQDELTFTTGNWSQPQTVTVSAASDGDTAAGTRDFSHTSLSDDINFTKSDHAKVTATEVEPAVLAGVVISPSSMRLVTVGQTEYLTVWLAKQPTADTTVYLAPHGNAGVTVTPQRLVFTTTNWNVPQVVSVSLTPGSGSGADGAGTQGLVSAQAQAATGQTDAAAQGIASLSVHVGSNDSGYSSLNVESVPLTPGAQQVEEPQQTAQSQGGDGAGATGAGESARGSERVAGADRYATAAAAADDYVTALAASGSAGAAGTVIVASGEDFPDALAAAALSRRLSAPILLTPPDRLDSSVSEFIRRRSVSSVRIVGGAAAVSADVEAALRELPTVTVVRRFAGSNRYETAVEIAKAAGAARELCSTGAATAILASGTSFADAVIAGPLSYRGAHPVLLTERDALPAVTLGYLRDAKVAQVLVVGGEAAVGAEVRSALRAAGIEVVGIGGANRYDTAARLARYVSGLGSAAGGGSAGCFSPSASVVGLASGLGFADALSAAPLLGERGALLLLTDPGGASVSAETLAYATGGGLTPRTSVTPIIVIGGSAAVPSAHVSQLAAAAGR